MLTEWFHPYMNNLSPHSSLAPLWRNRRSSLTLSWSFVLPGFVYSIVIFCSELLPGYSLQFWILQELIYSLKTIFFNLMVDTYDVSLHYRPVAIQVEHKYLIIMLQLDHQKDVYIALTAVLKCLPKQTISLSSSLLAFYSQYIFHPLPNGSFLCCYYLFFSPEKSSIS
jgi:hypothetical protein